MEKHFPRISEKGKLREVYPNFREFHTGTILFHVILRSAEFPLFRKLSGAVSAISW